MSRMLVKTLLTALLTCGFLISLVVALGYAHRATDHRKPGLPKQYFGGRLNHLLFTSHLTDEGLKLRRRSVTALGIALLCVWIAKLMADVLRN